MSSDNQYNGWSSYATWRVNREICDDLIEGLKEDDRKFADLYELSEYLKEQVDEILTGYGEITEGIALDYARSFVSDVDFVEIAEHAVDDLIDAEDNDDDDDTDMSTEAIKDRIASGYRNI